MGFRLVPKWVSLNDLEWRNGRLVCVISLNSVAFGPYITQKWLKIHRYILRVKCSPKNLVFSDISITAIFKGDHPNDDVKVQRPTISSRNFAYNQP